MKLWTRSIARLFKDGRKPLQNRRRSSLSVEQLEARNLLSVSPIAYKTGGYYDSADVNGIFYFSTTAGELWKTDGTPGGTALVKDLDPLMSSGKGPSGMTNVNGTLFFEFKDPANGQAAIWKSDGTDAGTVVVKDVDEYSAWSYSIKSYGELAAVNGFFYFTDVDSAGGHAALWKTDGTTAGTVMVKDLNAQSGPTNLNKLTNVNGTLFFLVIGFRGPESLWKSDGTSAGTVRVGPDLFGVAGLTNINGKLAFTSDAVVPAVNEYGNAYMKWVGEDLWITDGTDTGTVLVKQFVPSALGTPTDVNGTLFITENSYNDTKLWQSDGTVAGTTLVKDLGADIQIVQLTDFNGTLYFVGQVDHETGLWKSDGTEAGTTLIKELGEGDFDVSPLINANGKLYVSLYGEVIAFERPETSVLWESDGSEAGTTVVPETSTNPNFAWVFQLTSVNGSLFFVDLANTGPTNIQGLILGKVDDGNGPPSDPVDLSNLDGKTINDPPPEPGLVWPIFVPPSAPIPDSFSALLIPPPQVPETSPPNGEGTNGDVSNNQADASNVQVSLAISGSLGQDASPPTGSSQLGQSFQAHALSSDPLTASLGLANTSSNSSDLVLVRSHKTGGISADDELSTADLDSLLALNPTDGETAPGVMIY
jgi:ELWxxDGT repeat protein